MSFLKLRIITSNKAVYQDDVSSVTAPTASGEITVLYNHIPLFSLLKEGVLKVKKNEEEAFFSIGGGYLETTGKEINVLVSRAYHQDEIDAAAVAKAQESAKKLVAESKTDEERHAALAALRRSVIDLKVVGMKKKKTTIRV